MRVLGTLPLAATSGFGALCSYKNIEMPAAHPGHLSVVTGSAGVPGGMSCQYSEGQKSVTKALWPN